MAAITEDITGLDFGEKDIEGMPLLNGGRVVKKIPMTDESVTIKGYPVGVANDGTGMGAFFSGTATPAADPSTIYNDPRRREHRLVFTWREDLPQAINVGYTAGSTVPAGVSAYRVTVVNAYCTAYKPNFDDKILSAELTFKWAPFNKGGAPNKKEESTVVTTGLTAVTSTATTL